MATRRRAQTQLTWSSDDEAALELMKQRRAQFMAVNRRVVLDVIEEFYIAGTTSEELADALIGKAKDLRDALEPFDDGQRAAMPDEVKP